MNGLIIALYGIFLLVVGIRGNATQLLDETKRDVAGFLPWAFALVVLAILYEIDATRPIVKPFLVLLGLNFVLSNYDTITGELKNIQSIAAGAQ